MWLAPAPQWIVRALEQPKLPARRPVNLNKAPEAIRGIIRMIARAPEGERNRLAYWGACRLAELAEQQVIPRGDALDIVALRFGKPRRTSAPRGAQKQHAAHSDYPGRIR